MDPRRARMALYYDEDAFVESHLRAARPARPAGVMGRQVAGKEFLAAYLTHGTSCDIHAVVPDARNGQSLYRLCAAHESSRSRPRSLKLVQLDEFLPAFASDPLADVLHFPCPPEVRFAWAREHLGGDNYALCGVTHTLCSAPAVAALRELVTAPYEEYDRLICTSRAVVDMVRAVQDTYEAYLGERFGARPAKRLQLELIPLGVDVQRFVPATDEQRAAERGRLNIKDDEVVALFVGRFAHHAKAHPFPMYKALSEAARRTQHAVHLVMAGWAAVPAVREAFIEGAQRFAPGVRLTFLDGNQPEARSAVWRAADIFVSLSDNIQETFGLVIVEAMASGLPVIASDWNGYRDLVSSGVTGFLVPTYSVEGATGGLTAQLLLGEVNYDHFLARSNQCIAVDVQSTAEAFAQLINDPELRRRMGAAARQRAVGQFAWQHIVRSYEQLWAAQAEQLAAFRASSTTRRRANYGPSAYPPLDVAFAGYPTRRLDEEAVVASTPSADSLVAVFAMTPLTNYEARQRCSNIALLAELLDKSRNGQMLGQIVEAIASAGYTSGQAQATVAWLLKYDLLRAVPDRGPGGGSPKKMGE